MLGWMIVLGVCIIATIVFFVLANEDGSHSDWNIPAWIMVIVSAILICVVVFTPLDVKVQMGKFELQKTYVEHHVAKSSLEDATITNTKITMNEWLFQAKQCNLAYGTFSFYPDTIQELEPIN